MRAGRIASERRWTRRRWMVALPLTVGAVLAIGSAPGRAGVAPPPIGWSQGPSLPAGFSPRWDVAAAYFPPMDEVVLFGGAPANAGDVWRNETWLYSVQTGQWTQGPAAPQGLKARGGAAMAYDPDNGKLVLFGGAGTAWPPANDTWLFNGTKWSAGPTAPAGMGGRMGAEMAYHPGIRKLVLFGGSGQVPYNDTWLYDGVTNSWSAGPAAPPEMQPRVYFGMTYDEALGRVVLAGGDGEMDVWTFDGLAWTRGSDWTIDVGPLERVRMVYDPDLMNEAGLGGDLVFGGMGPVSDNRLGYFLRDGVWSFVLPNPDNPTPPGPRFQQAMLWVPTLDAVMMVGGVHDGGWGTALTDTWFFRDVPPQASWLNITPPDPDPSSTLTLDIGPVTGGYLSQTREIEWFLNGVLLPDQTGPVLYKAVVHGDQVQAKVRYYDALDVYGPWVSSTTVTIANRAPGMKTVSLSPTSPTATDTITATATGTDPDGDAITFHYAWTVNGNPAGSDAPTLAPSTFKVGDSVAVSVTPTDALGMSGPPMAGSPVTINYNLQATTGTVVPGGKTLVRGAGYDPNENVDIHLDSVLGALLATVPADGGGGWQAVYVNFPSPLSGGTHMMYGIGQLSGKVGQGPVLVTPTGSITPTKFSAGAPVTFNGVGFMPGESVAVSFSGYGPTNVIADGVGTAAVTMTAPPEPNTGGSITAVAGSGTVSASFQTTPKETVPLNGTPGKNATVSVTGYAAGETVNFSIDTGATSVSGITDSFGSLSASVPLTGYFGKHTVWAKGVSSGISLGGTITYQPTMKLTPTSGPRGTVVTVTSGPGWSPGESLTFKVNTKTYSPKIVAQDGTVSFTFTIPTSQPLGQAKFRLISSVLRNQSALAIFTVTG